MPAPQELENRSSRLTKAPCFLCGMFVLPNPMAVPTEGPPAASPYLHPFGGSGCICTFTAWEPRPAPRKCPADKSQCELLKDYFPRPTRGRWKWVLSGAAVWQGHSHPAQGQPRPGGAPCLRSLWLDPALNNQLSCRIPRGVLGAKCSGNPFSLAQPNNTSPPPPPRAWGNLLKNPK